jgi:hypothetical protein
VLLKRPYITHHTQAAYEQAHKEFGAEVDREVEAARAARTAEAEAGARNVAVNHIVEVGRSEKE